jgi:dihydropyrimidine dehydrogenase (NAD+) subunit PreA
MADLSVSFAGIHSPNPFWLASAPPTTTPANRSCAHSTAGWGGAVWKTLGDPIVDSSSRFGALHVNGTRMVGFNNIELITDRPLEVNLREVREVKRLYPKHAVIVSLMVETEDDWRTIIKRSHRRGCGWPGTQLRLPATACASAAWARRSGRSRGLEIVAGWAVKYSSVPC